MSPNGKNESIMEVMVDNNNELTEKQKNIVKAAIDIFAKKGYASSSTSEIAKQAGVAEGTIFRHYNTKKDLLLSIVSPVMSQLVAPMMIQDMDEILHEDYETLEDFLRAVLKNRIVFVEKNLPIVKIMLQEIPFHTELKEQFKANVGKFIMKRIATIIDHFKEKGDLVDWPTPTIIRLMVSSGIGYVFSRYLLFPDFNWNEQEMENTIDFIVKGLKKEKETT